MSDDTSGALPGAKGRRPRRQAVQVTDTLATAPSPPPYASTIEQAPPSPPVEPSPVVGAPVRFWRVTSARRLAHFGGGRSTWLNPGKVIDVNAYGGPAILATLLEQGFLLEPMSP